MNVDVRMGWDLDKVEVGKVGLPCSSNDKESACNARDPSSIPGSGRFLWRREWQSTPVFLPGESQGQRILAGYSPWDPKQSDWTNTTID